MKNIRALELDIKVRLLEFDKLKIDLQEFEASLDKEPKSIALRNKQFASLIKSFKSWAAKIDEAANSQAKLNDSLKNQSPKKPVENIALQLEELGKLNSILILCHNKQDGFEQLIDKVQIKVNKFEASHAAKVDHQKAKKLHFLLKETLSSNTFKQNFPEAIDDIGSLCHKLDLSNLESTPSTLSSKP